MLCNKTDEPFKIFRRKKSWCASAQMQFTYQRFFGQQRQIEFKLFFNHAKVFLFNTVIGCNFFVTSTIRTQRFAKW